MRKLCVVLGDQLDRHSSLFDDFDREQDCVWMAEVMEEATHVWSAKQRIAVFLSAMRHFAEDMQQQGLPVEYLQLESHVHTTLAEALAAAIETHRPEQVCVVLPGDYRVLQALQDCCEQQAVPLEVLDDRHFISTLDQFEEWAEDRKQFRMEFWYRYQRKRNKVLMEEDGKPLGGRWNYDSENRKTFGKHGPGLLPEPLQLQTDAITDEVIALVEKVYAEHPGSLERFNWPVTPQQAEDVLQHFLEAVLPYFGDYQDAMWTDQPYLYHSLLSSSLNLKLLEPFKVVRAVEQCYHDSKAPLAAVEGYIRQLLGWREYIRGLYWRYMPQWLEWNALEAGQELPAFYWHGDTGMHCMAQAIGQTMETGYAHHIHRLMVTGLFSLMYGVKPEAIHSWYLAVYVDAVEWVELPNTVGMSQYADDGMLGSKPYIASGKYIQRMSNYCKDCRYDPAQASGDDACPFTTLYWDFMQQHYDKFKAHPRMTMMYRNLERLDADKLTAIQQRATEIRSNPDGL